MATRLQKVGLIMRLFIAEKPELAKAIVAGLGGDFKRKDGYYIRGCIEFKSAAAK